MPQFLSSTVASSTNELTWQDNIMRCICHVARVSFWCVPCHLHDGPNLLHCRILGPPTLHHCSLHPGLVAALSLWYIILEHLKIMLIHVRHSSLWECWHSRPTSKKICTAEYGGLADVWLSKSWLADLQHWFTWSNIQLVGLMIFRMSLNHSNHGDQLCSWLYASVCKPRLR